MNGKLVLAFLATAAVFGVSQAAIPIGGDLLSTIRIVAKLCLCKRTEETAAKFFACYDQAPGKAQFVSCQIKTFGTALNTKSAVTTACLNPTKLKSYATCLETEFKNAGIDQADAITKVNTCQAVAVGISRNFF